MSIENTHLGAERISEILSSSRSIFFIGIGGINMSSLAHISKKRGFLVGGSDRARSRLTDKLSDAGIEIYYGHSSDNVKGYDAVVYTVAISADNPEYVYAMANNIPCISRADYLGYIMMGYETRIGISGMHGKSSCTSMCAETFIRGGAEPTVLSGAELGIMNGAYTVGKDKLFVFEACEYMDSFLDFNPNVAVILNIEMDHVDYFKSMEQIRRSFARFADKTGKCGYAVYNCDDGEVISALADYDGNRITFGIKNESAAIRAVNVECIDGRYAFDVVADGEMYCHIRLSVTGYHNIYNALATVAVCRLCGLDREKTVTGLEGFHGAARRMEFKGTVRGCSIYDDYGHHPTEVKTTLMGARGLARSGGRLMCVFQPHTYSRTAALFNDFCEALSVADKVFLADIYAARETDTLGVSSELLASEIGEKARAGNDLSTLVEMLNDELTANDVVVVMGAGDIYKIFDIMNFDTEGEK